MISYKTLLGDVKKDKKECISINKEIVDTFTFFQNSNQFEIESILNFCKEIPVLYNKFIEIKNNKKLKI